MMSTTEPKPSLFDLLELGDLKRRNRIIISAPIFLGGQSPVSASAIAIDGGSI